ncbi:MAG: (2Fe-2S) ferredoxin domain-containing protein [Desulfobacteraceae bacterium]|nr:(2Fe-2S) ferredoxin domain-containing protein [Desulfobacteraceae bacterium]
MGEKIALHLCMGSACYQLGVHRVLPALQKLMQDHCLEAEIELKGAFCLDNCMHGIVIKVGEKTITGINPENVEIKFAREILPALKNNSQG